MKDLKLKNRFNIKRENFNVIFNLDLNLIHFKN